MTKKEIVSKLEELKIDHDSTASKEELEALLPESGDGAGGPKSEPLKVDDDEAIATYKANGFFQVFDLPSGNRILMGPRGERISPITGSDGIIPNSEGQSIVKMCDTFNSTSPDVREYKLSLERNRRTRDQAIKLNS